MVRALLTFLPALLGIGAAPPPAATPSDPIAQAAAHLAARDYDHAVRILSGMSPASLAPDARREWWRILAVAHAEGGRFGEALRAAEACERALDPSAPDETRADLDYVRGRAAWSRFASAEATRHLERSVEAARRAGLKALMARAYEHLAIVFLNDADQARFFEYSRLAFELNPNPDDAARIDFLARRGAAYQEFQEIDLAEEHFRQALELALKVGDVRRAARTHHWWGLLYGRTNIDRERAIWHYQQGLRLTEGRTERGLLAQRMMLLNAYANQFRDNPMTGDRALSIYREALDLARRLGEIDRIPSILRNIGRVYRLHGRLKEAEPLLLEAVSRADVTDAVDIRWQAPMELGDLYGVHARARRVRVGPRWQAPMELGHLYAQRGSKLADRYYRETLDALEGEYSNVLLDNFRAVALAASRSMYDDPYDAYIQWLLDQGEPERAFAVAERSSARGFLDGLIAAREQIARRVPVEYVREERELLRRISERQARLRAADLTPQERQALRAEVVAEEAKLDQMRMRLATEVPAVALARYPRLTTAEEARRTLLGGDEALVVFFLGQRRSAAWVLRRERMTVATLPGRDEIARSVRPFLEALQAPTSNSRAAGAELSHAVLAPVLDALGGMHRLVIVPAGALHYVPFEALTDGEGRYLVERFAISYAPSVSSLAYLRRQRPSSGDQVIALGNPVLSGEASAERLVAVEHLALLKPLPYSSSEVQSIAGIFGGAAEVLEQERATEASLSPEALGRAAIVHFATHGLIDERKPERSGLALTASPPDSDGILQMREVYGLRLRAGLVTLSACQTALGKQITGEGLIGLSRAFFFAGANAVMASLWNVNDASTARFMTAFYRAIRDGTAIDDAAQQAKRRLLADARLGHPYYWASFVVIGQAAAPIQVSAPAPWRAAAAGGVLLLGAAGAAWAIRRRTASRRPRAHTSTTTRS